MKTKEQAQLSLLSNEIILKGQLIKFKEVENEMNRIKHGLEFTQKEIEKNKEILNGLSLSEIENVSNGVLNKIFNPNLEIFVQVWSEDDGENLEDSDYRVWGSHFYEWGVTYNSRIFKNNNLLHAKYGLSLMYNNLRPTDNRYFVKNGDQTDLVTSTIKLDDSRFRNVYLTAPLHLEFDFTPKKLSKDGTKTYFRTHESVRLGIGGYGGVRIKSKQILKYEIDDVKVKEKQKGDFNVSDFTYGLSAYLGYGQTSLYVKYDLNPMFKNNNIDQNNVSLGLRFDFN